MRKIALTEKIILTFLFTGIIIIIIIASYSYYSSRNNMINRTFDQLNSVQTLRKNQLENFFSDRIRDIRLISSSEDAQGLLNLLNEPSKKDSHKINIEGKIINSAYQSYLSKYFDNYLIINRKSSLLNIKTNHLQKDSIYIESAKNFPVEEIIKNIEHSGNVYIQDFKINHKNQHLSMYIGAPVINNNQQISGFIVLEISCNAINELIFEKNPQNGLGKTGESYLVGNDFLMRSNSRFYENAMMKTIVNTKSANIALKGQTGKGLIKDYRNLDVLSVYTPLKIPNLNWCIISEIDLKEAMIPVYKLRNNTLFISILLVIILIVFAFFISKKIIHPILVLKDAAIKIGKGENIGTLQIESKDEIGILTESFNLMMSHLEQQSQELQKERLLRLQSVIDGQEMERQRLSRELHDGLGQLLIAIKLKLESLIFTDRSKLLYTIEGIKTLFDSTIDEVKRISYDLMPAVLYEFGLSKAIGYLCEDIENRTHIAITFTFECDSDKLDKVMKTYLFRIVQEALNNVLKHSEATKVKIFLQLEKNEIYLKIEDNGKGFDLEQKLQLLKTNGIYNMRERVHLLNGFFEIESIQGKGTVIDVKILLSKDKD